MITIQGKYIRLFFTTPQNNGDWATRAAKDGSGSMQQRCFVHVQNSPSTVVHGCTTVEDGSNGLTTSIILRFLSILPGVFARPQEKVCEVLNKTSHKRKVNA